MREGSRGMSALEMQKRDQVGWKGGAGVAGTMKDAA